MVAPSYTGPTEIRRCSECREIVECAALEGFRRKPGYCPGCDRMTEKQRVSDPVARAYRNGWDV